MGDDYGPHTPFPLDDESVYICVLIFEVCRFVFQTFSPPRFVEDVETILVNVTDGHCDVDTRVDKTVRRCHSKSLRFPRDVLHMLYVVRVSDTVVLCQSVSEF